MNPADGHGGARVGRERQLRSTPDSARSNAAAIDLTWDAFVVAVNAHRAIGSVHSHAAAVAAFRSFNAEFGKNDEAVA